MLTYRQRRQQCVLLTKGKVINEKPECAECLLGLRRFLGVCLTVYFTGTLSFWAILFVGYLGWNNLLSLASTPSRTFAVRIAFPFFWCIILLASSIAAVYFARIRPRRSTILLICIFVTSVSLFTYDALTESFQVSFTHPDGPYLHTYLYCNWWWYDWE